jgi:predicted nuclease of predicted toxin-antitoxin system
MRVRDSIQSGSTLWRSRLRILANENFPGEAVEALRSQGHDVAWVGSDAAGITDIEVVKRASTEGRILLTFDKDFGELVFRTRVPAPPGIILFRIPPDSPERVARNRCHCSPQSQGLGGEF